MTRVVNIKDEECDISIMRPGRWGNPFLVGRDGSHEEVIAKYRAWLPLQADLMDEILDLQGLRLGCCCKPGPCHGDVIVEMIEGVDDEPVSLEVNAKGWSPDWLVLPGGAGIFKSEMEPACRLCGCTYYDVFTQKKGEMVQVDHGCPRCLKKPKAFELIGWIDRRSREYFPGSAPDFDASLSTDQT